MVIYSQGRNQWLVWSTTIPTNGQMQHQHLIRIEHVRGNGSYRGDTDSWRELIFYDLNKQSDKLMMKACRHWGTKSTHMFNSQIVRVGHVQEQ